jgi:hypothetical protein
MSQNRGAIERKKNTGVIKALHDKNEAKADANKGEKESALRPTFCRSAEIFR